MTIQEDIDCEKKWLKEELKSINSKLKIAIKERKSIENLINEFHLLCKNLYGFIKGENEKEIPIKIKLLEEIYGNEYEAHVKDGSQIVLIHYHIHKIIPNTIQ
jgi:hypothetical protein